MGDGLRRANAAARASRHDPEAARAALDAASVRERCWARVDSETWSYVPRSWQWRATVTVRADRCTWEFFTLDGDRVLGSGHSADLAIVRRAVKAGPPEEAPDVTSQASASNSRPRGALAPEDRNLSPHGARVRGIIPGLRDAG